MKALVTRDSCCAGDDVVGPHERRLRLPERWSWPELVGTVWRGAHLPANIQGGGTWALFSKIPLAVAAQGWDHPRLLSLGEADRAALDRAGGLLRFHWRYYQQQDPEAVAESLQRQLDGPRP